MMYERSTPYQMDSKWCETQSFSQTDITTQLHQNTERYGRETPSFSKMEFNPNDMAYHLNTFDGSSSYHEKTQSFQSDFQNGMPLHALHYPNDSKTANDSKTDIQFHETGTYRRIPVTHKKIYSDNTPGVTSLVPREVQKPRMPPYLVGLQSDSDNSSQYHQGSSTHGIPSYQTKIPREVRRPDQAVNPNEIHLIYSNDTPGVTSLDPREVQKRMPPYMEGIRSNSKSSSQSDQASSSHGILSYQTAENPRGVPPDQQMNAEQEKVCDQEASSKRLPFCHQTPRNLLHQICTENQKMSSFQTSRSQEGIPSYQSDCQEEALTYQADAKTYEEMNDCSNQTKADRRMSPYQPSTPEQTSHNTLSGTQACPRCHCMLKTQPQPSYPPARVNLQNARPSVIMIPLNRKVEKAKETRSPTTRDQEWPTTRDKTLKNVDSDLSMGEVDNNGEQERYFRVNIDGTTAVFKLTEEDWARMPVKSFPSGGRLLSGDWTRIFLSKVKESNPWCSLRFKSNHVRSENSRKMHTAAFFRGGAECKCPECNVKIKFVIRKEYGKRVDVAYVGNVCHSSQSDVGKTRDNIRARRHAANPRAESSN